MFGIVGTRASTGGRGRAVGVAAMALLALLLSCSARASTSQETIFDGGFHLTEGTAKERDARLAELRRLGADTVRVELHWRELAPAPERSAKPPGFDAADPRAYDRGTWAPFDQVVRGAADRGMGVLITLAGPVPDWASQSGHSDLADPKPGAFEDFVTAVGRRYSGAFMPAVGLPLPRVGYWSVWNEPNLEEFLQP